MNQKHGFPAFLSLVIPGLGQLVKGDTAKGIGIIAMTIVVAPVSVAIVVAAGAPLLSIPLVIGMVVGWLWQVVDAYNANQSREKAREVEDLEAWRKSHGA